MNTTRSTIRSQIKRGRTGCFTCRKRKKKCDEAKPHCQGCRRAGYVCEGYPSPIRLQDSPYTKRTPLPYQQNEPMFGYTDSDIAINTLWPGPPNQPDDFSNWFLPDDDFGAFGQVQDVTDTSPSMFGKDIPALAIDLNSPSPSYSTTTQSIPRSLPFLINGIDTAIEQQFFTHFTHTTSRVLTTSSTHNNPLLTIVLPRCLQDPMIQKATLCLGGSHLMRLHPHAAAELEVEKQRLLKAAEEQHTARISTIKTTKTRMKSSELETLLCGALLLCLYEISEGSGGIAWRLRLDAARDVIRGAVENAISPSEMNISQFLIEFFLYHDVLGGVTDSIPPAFEPAATLASGSTKGDELYMIGVDNGLFDLIAKIANLRAATVKQDQRQSPDANVVSQALEIWGELDAWEPTTNDRDHRLASSAYISALFVWLYSIVYPQGIADEKVQLVVTQGLDYLQQIQVQGTMAVLLFPAFVLGFSSVLAEQRAQTVIQFEKMTRFSGMGNVRLARGVVERWWKDYDAGSQCSWDWIEQMQLHGICLPVT